MAYPFCESIWSGPVLLLMIMTLMTLGLCPQMTSELMVLGSLRPNPFTTSIEKPLRKTVDYGDFCCLNRVYTTVNKSALLSKSIAKTYDLVQAGCIILLFTQFSDRVPGWSFLIRCPEGNYGKHGCDPLLTR